jgi:hypothetical protein
MQDILPETGTAFKQQSRNGALPRVSPDVGTRLTLHPSCRLRSWPKSPLPCPSPGRAMPGGRMPHRIPAHPQALEYTRQTHLFRAGNELPLESGSFRCQWIIRNQEPRDQWHHRILPSSSESTGHRRSLSGKLINRRRRAPSTAHRRGVRLANRPEGASHPPSDE